MENNIRIVRLKDQTDIIAFIDIKEEYFVLYDPLLMSIQHYRGNQGRLVLLNWLPHSLITENVASLKTEDILMTMIPNDELIEHYLDTIDKTKTINVKSMDELSDEEMVNMMEVMEEMSKAGKDLILH